MVRVDGHEVRVAVQSLAIQRLEFVHSEENRVTGRRRNIEALIRQGNKSKHTGFGLRETSSPHPK